MSIKYKSGNILNEIAKTPIAFAVSGDFTLGAGLAKEIDSVCQVSDKLKANYGTIDDTVGCSLRVDPFFCLVVKNHYRDTTYADDILDCLIELARQCDDLDLTEIAMPKICTGHEDFKWNEIVELIEDAFVHSDTDVVIYTLDEEELDDNTFDDEEDDFDNGFIDDEDTEPVTDSRKCFLYNAMLSHLEEIYDENALYELLLSLGFTHEEIAYEGLVPDDCDCCDCDDEDCDCGCGCHCHDDDHECTCGGNCHCHEDAVDHLIATEEAMDEERNIMFSIMEDREKEENIMREIAHECRCQSKPTEPTETETKETCCGGKYIDEEECEECDGCSCDGNCQGHTCEHE